MRFFCFHPAKSSKNHPQYHKNPKINHEKIKINQEKSGLIKQNPDFFWAARIFAPTCDLLIKLSKYILTFFDSADIKSLIPLICVKNEVFFKNTCGGRKNVVILHPQSGNDGGTEMKAQTSDDGCELKRTMTYCHKTSSGNDPSGLFHWNWDKGRTNKGDRDGLSEDSWTEGRANKFRRYIW